ncbi:MAG: helix-turn-helix domain-containing protein [Actinobacteria bacterium]|nr:helix-turn-helix domain-containing protein [Actinomycetota bacterium]
MSEYRVPALLAASRLLNYLADKAPDGATQSELAGGVELSKSSAHNMLATLEDIGWVHRDAARLFRLGPGLIHLGSAATKGGSVVALARDRIGGLAAEYGISFAIARRTVEGDAQVVDRHYPSTDEHVGVRIGARYDGKAGALGKALLALMSEAEAEAVLADQKLVAHTPRTITDSARLLAEADEARQRGWAASEGELNDNYAVVGFAPSKDPTQQIFLLGLGFPSQLDAAQVKRLGKRLAALAVELNHEAGLGTES